MYTEIPNGHDSTVTLMFFIIWLMLFSIIIFILCFLYYYIKNPKMKLNLSFSD